MKIGATVHHPNTDKVGKVINRMKIKPADRNFNSDYKVLVQWDDKEPFSPNNPDKMLQLDDGLWVSLEDVAYRRYKENGGTWVLSSFLKVV